MRKNGGTKAAMNTAVWKVIMDNLPEKMISGLKQVNLRRQHFIDGKGENMFLTINEQI